MAHNLYTAYNTHELGQVVRKTRELRKLTQADLADRLGVSRMTVSRLERGDRVSVETAIRTLSECGYALVIAPKFARLRFDEEPPSLSVSAIAHG